LVRAIRKVLHADPTTGSGNGGTNEGQKREDLETHVLFIKLDGDKSYKLKG
jgi:hypothetical protein